jgi:hypothetical protein
VKRQIDQTIEQLQESFLQKSALPDASAQDLYPGHTVLWGVVFFTNAGSALSVQ